MEAKTVLIQRTLLNDLKGFIFEYNEYNKPNLKLDIAVYYLSLEQVYRKFKTDLDTQMCKLL